MTNFPSDATDKQLYASENGAYYVFDKKKNQWQSTTVIPKWTDQVYIRGEDNVTQQTTNESFDSRFLKLSEINEISDKFRLVGSGGTYVSATGAEMHLYHVADATDNKHGANWGQIKRYADDVTTETFYTFENLGDTGGLAPTKITYSTEHGGQFTVPSKPKSGPWLGNGVDYFGWRPWTGQFSIAVEEEPKRWRTILMGVTSEIRYSTTSSGNTFYEVKISDADLIVNTPDVEYNGLKCTVKIAGLF